MNDRRDKVTEKAAPYVAAPPADDWVHELVAMTRPGVEIEFPVRRIDERIVPFAYDDFH